MEMDALLQKLGATYDEIQRVQGEVVESLKAFFGGTSALSAEEALKIASRWSNKKLSTDESDMDIRIRRLNDTLLDIVGQLQLDGDQSNGIQNLVTSMTQRERIKRQMEQSRRMLQLVEKVIAVDNALYDIDVQLSAGNVVAAAEAILRTDELLCTLCGHDKPLETSMQPQHNDEDIVDVLRLHLLKKKNRLVCELRQAHASSFSSKMGMLRATTPTFQVPVATSPAGPTMRCILWQGTKLMGLLQQQLHDLAKVVSQYILKPLFSNARAAISIKQFADGMALKVVESEVSQRSGGEFIELRFVQLREIIQFLHVQVFDGDTALMGVLGDMLWKSPGNLESQLLTCLQEKIPKEAVAISGYRAIVTRVVSELDVQLQAIGIMVMINSDIQQFSDQINQMYAKNRRQQLLITARNTMSSDYRNHLKVMSSTERGIGISSGKGKKDGKATAITSSGIGDSREEAENSCFEMPNYCVTHCAHDIVELAHQTLIEACSSDFATASTLLQTSRDMLFLFRAIIPTLYQDEIANDARTCMLFHNDCLYISHHMLTIGYHYKKRIPSPLAQITTMVDMAPAFRDAGEKALVTFVSSVSSEMRSGLHKLKEHGGVNSEVGLLNLEDFLKSTLYKLNNLSTAWRGYLPVSIYNKVFGQLVQPLVTSFIDCMLSESKIASTAAGKLYHLTCLLLESTASFDSAAQADKYIPSMPKLRAFSQLLVQPIKTIQDSYVNGDFNTFSSDEISTLIKSIFRDSNERRDFLRIIK